MRSAFALLMVMVVLSGCASTSPTEQEVKMLHERVQRLRANAASGGGVNAKMMLDALTRAATVPLEEIFSFDRHHAMCRVDTNRQAFVMPTYQLGDVVIAPVPVNNLVGELPARPSTNLHRTEPCVGDDLGVIAKRTDPRGNLDGVVSE